jgi:hypothetical protein
MASDVVGGHEYMLGGSKTKAEHNILSAERRVDENIPCDSFHETSLSYATVLENSEASPFSVFGSVFSPH